MGLDVIEEKKMAIPQEEVEEIEWRKIAGHENYGGKKKRIYNHDYFNNEEVKENYNQTNQLQLTPL